MSISNSVMRGGAPFSASIKGRMLLLSQRSCVRHWAVTLADGSGLMQVATRIVRHKS